MGYGAESRFKGLNTMDSIKMTGGVIISPSSKETPFGDPSLSHATSKSITVMQENVLGWTSNFIVV